VFEELKKKSMTGEHKEDGRWGSRQESGPLAVMPVTNEGSLN
jgi:hypothetical protein